MRALAFKYIIKVKNKSEKRQSLSLATNLLRKY
jgi:hypothetical protein